MKNKQTQLVRLVIAGSVDDGKSTLIGRLLYDSDSISEDQLQAAKQASKRRGMDEIDLSLITDGLASEREQGITIDVAYRYFSLPTRKFIIADVPGHEQYTRNMVTGASTADIAVILVDSSNGLTEQSKRHISIASILGIPHIAIVLNKMDLVDYSESSFVSAKDEIMEFASKLNINDLQFIPASALEGDMIVERQENMKWYNGPTLLSFLENIAVTPDRNLVDFRMPVQYVLNSEKGRGYSGKITSGSIKSGEELVILPSGEKTKIKNITIGGENKDSAHTPQSSVLYMEDELDISRGDMISRVDNQPTVASGFQAKICWMNKQDLNLDKKYLLKHTSRTVDCEVSLNYKLNVNTLHREEVETLSLNDIGKVTIATHEPIMFDPYDKNRNTGNFLLIDRQTKDTVAAGMIIKQKDVDYKNLNTKKGAVLWFTGLSGSGKSTVANNLEEKLNEFGVSPQRLDGDILRNSLCSDLGFTEEDRRENIKRAGFVADMLSSNGVLVLSSFITPYSDQREELRDKMSDRFVEVFVDASVEECEKRDVKGLYKQAREGKIKNFTGITHPYEKPENPDIKINTENESIEESADKVFDYLLKNKIIK